MYYFGNCSNEEKLSLWLPHSIPTHFRTTLLHESIGEFEPKAPNS